LFQFLNYSLVSAALASLLLDFLPQEADGFCVFLLFFGVELGLSVEFVGQFYFLVQHLLDLLHLSFIYHALPSLVLDGLPQGIDFLVVLHANAVALQNLFFAFAQHCLQFADGGLVGHAFVALFLDFFTEGVEFLFIFVLLAGELIEEV